MSSTVQTIDITPDTDTDAMEGQTFDSQRWGRVEVIGAGHFTHGEAGGVMFTGRDDQGNLHIAVWPYGDQVTQI